MEIALPFIYDEVDDDVGDNGIFFPRQYFDVDTDFVQRFRINREICELIINRIGNQLTHERDSKGALTPNQQLLTCLRFLATNGFYHLVRDSHGPSESTVCRTVRRVVDALIATFFNELIQWPQDARHLAQRFMAKGGMPSVCGLVDGTHVNMKAPSINEHQFINRHGVHSLNVMVIGGPDNEIFYVDPRWPGSVNDARVMRNSNIFTASENGWRPFPDSVILGDSIYPLREWLIPPLPGNQQGIQGRFNTAHRQTRRIVEQTFGMLKNRFSVLRFVRVLTPEYAAKIVKACCILHNLCLLDRFEFADPIIMEPIDDDLAGDDFNIAGRQRRERLIQFFRG